MKKCIRISAALLSQLLFVSCKRDASFVDVAIPSVEVVETVRPASPLLEWHRRTLVEAYDKVGHHGRRWDMTARDGLSRFAEYLAARGSGTNDSASGISNAIVQAVAAGCDDPMVLYLRARFTIPHRTNTLEECGIAHLVAAKGLYASGYPAVRKFYAFTRTLEAVDSAPALLRQEGTLEFRQQMVKQGKALFLQALDGDSSLPAHEAFELVQAYFDSTAYAAEPTSLNYTSVEDRLFIYYPENAELYLQKGLYHFEVGWRARGILTADAVTPEGWAGFEKQLAYSEEALAKAWALDPTDPRIPEAMLVIELGQGKGRERMESWFARAMALDPGDLRACLKKQHYLLPQWYGSFAEILKFGRECAASTNWSPRVSLMIAHAHELVAEQSGERDYWSRPQVWTEIKQSFDSYFARTTNQPQPRIRQWYARLAYRCGQGEEVAAQLPLMGEDIDYTLFGGPHTFARVVEKGLAFKKSVPTSNK